MKKTNFAFLAGAAILMLTAMPAQAQTTLDRPSPGTAASLYNYSNPDRAPGTRTTLNYGREERPGTSYRPDWEIRREFIERAKLAEQERRRTQR